MRKELSVEETAAIARAHYESGSAAIHELDDDELAEMLVEAAFESGEKIRSMTFRHGSSAALVRFANHFFGSDDAGVYGPFRTIEEAIDGGPQFWGHDDILDDKINPRFRAAFPR